jgi:hypothetical protein
MGSDNIDRAGAFFPDLALCTNGSKAREGIS